MLQRIFATLLVLSLAGTQALAQTGKDVYRGKTITLLVGFGPGGGYDLYSRILARFISKYIPGEPTVVVSNMSTAGGLRAANHAYMIAPKDGTVIACVSGSLLTYQLLGGGNAEYDSTKLQWILSATNSILTWHTSGIKTIEDAKTHDVPFGTGGPASTSHIYPAVANAVLGTKFRLTPGYTGSNSLDLAMENGEVMGRSGANLNSLFARNSDWVRDKKVNFLVEIGFKRDPHVPDVPILGELVTTTRQRQIVDIATLPTAVGYAYWVAPDVPQQQVSILRDAFARALADPDLVSQVKQAGFDVTKTSAEELSALVESVAKAPQDVKAEAAALLSVK